MRLVVVRGVSDVGSAVAIHDGPHPTTSRRANAFTDAVFDGAGRALTELLYAHRSIPVSVGDFGELVRVLRPAVVVDARMRKRANPESQRGCAPLTIGLGPGFIAGHEGDAALAATANVDVTIETSWRDLGQVIASGPTLPLTGDPRPLGGHSRDRFISTSVAGTFHTNRRIGDRVRRFVWKWPVSTARTWASALRTRRFSRHWMARCAD